MRARVPTLTVAALVALAPGVARGDQGERWLGVAVALESPRAVGVDGTVDLGLGDSLSARLGLGGRAGEGGLVAVAASAGLFWAWDVFTWVPELGVTAGARVRGDGGGDRLAGTGALELGLTRYLGLSTAIRLSLSGGLSTGASPFAALTVALRWRA